MDVLLKQLARVSVRTMHNLPSAWMAPATSVGLLSKCSFHTSALALADRSRPMKWSTYNKKIFPPIAPGEERRPAYVCHVRKNIKYSPSKMWYVASMIRGMSVEEAIKQLTFINKKGAAIVKEVLLEAQDLAVQDHYVEYKSNLWVAESFATQGIVIKGIRRHAKARPGIVHYRHCHYFVRLEEGSPPKHYFLDRVEKTTQEHLSEWIGEMRQRRIPGSL